MLMAGDLDMGHARALLALPAAQQVMAAHEISARKLSVREAENAWWPRGARPASPLRRQQIQAARHPAAGRAPGRPC
jgi:ParB family chromosome partitioning protein